MTRPLSRKLAAELNRAAVTARQLRRQLARVIASSEGVSLRDVDAIPNRYKASTKAQLNRQLADCTSLLAALDAANALNRVATRPPPEVTAEDRANAAREREARRAEGVVREGDL